MREKLNALFFILDRRQRLLGLILIICVVSNSVNISWVFGQLGSLLFLGGKKIQ